MDAIFLALAFPKSFDIVGVSVGYSIVRFQGLRPLNLAWTDEAASRKTRTWQGGKA